MSQSDLPSKRDHRYHAAGRTAKMRAEDKQKALQHLLRCQQQGPLTDQQKKLLDTLQDKDA